jgi:hypothetical protein
LRPLVLTIASANIDAFIIGDVTEFLLICAMRFQLESWYLFTSAAWISWLGSLFQHGYARPRQVISREPVASTTFCGALAVPPITSVSMAR